METKIPPSYGARRPQRSTSLSRTSRRDQECLTALLHHLTGVPYPDLWAALEQLPAQERERATALANEITESSRARPTSAIRRGLVARAERLR
jgi:hypothetical protein